LEELNKKTTHLLSDLGRKLLPETSGLEDGEHVSEYCARLLDGISHKMETNYSDRLAIEVSKNETAVITEKGTGNGVRASIQRAKAPSGFVSYMRSTLKEKPQQSFEDAVDNSNKPFVHYFGNLKGVDVGYLNERRDSALAAGLPCPHPLKETLDDLDKHYLEAQLQKPHNLTKPKEFSDTKFSYIDSLSDLRDVVGRLNNVHEMAVDLEAHNHRSFLGFCCLMQISTREEDIIIDVIKLRSHIGKLLGPLFANPKVVKVFHGSRSDIVWLQRDFGIYVCNLFDTGIAARVLNYSGHGLGYLLSKLCGFDADKRFQLADWRIRPLSEESIHYARADTHYLLYCYDVLRDELATLSQDHIPDEFSLGEYRPESGIFAVLEASRKLCYSMFEKELFHDFSFIEFYSRSERKFGVLNDQQLAVFAALYAWRDEIARERDESPGFVMSRANMVEVAKAVPQSHKSLKVILKKKSSIGIAESKDLHERIMKFLEDDCIVSRARAKLLQGDHGQKELPEKRKLPLDLHTEDQRIHVHGSQFVPKQFEKNIDIISSKNAHGMMMRKASENVAKRKAVARAIKGNASIPIEVAALSRGDSRSEHKPQSNSNDVHEKDRYKQEIDSTPTTCDIVDAAEANITNPGGKIVDDNAMSEDMIPLLPLPLSEQKGAAGKSRRRRLHKGSKQISSKNGNSLEGSKPRKDPKISEDMFDPHEAVTKYNSKKRPSAPRNQRRNPKQEIQPSIPSGMFNPYGDLQSLGSRSRRSTTQVRSGNRTANFK